MIEYFLLFFNYIEINIENNFTLTFLIFFFFLTFYHSLSIPGNSVFIGATGYFFGIYIGFFLSIISIVIGSLIFFSFSHLFINKFFPNIFFKYANKIKKYISNSTLEYLIVFRIIPGPPLFVQNLILSLLNIDKKKFIISSFIGFSPIVFSIVFIGNSLKNIERIFNISPYDFFNLKILIVFLCIIFLILIRIFYKK